MIQLSQPMLRLEMRLESQRRRRLAAQRALACLFFAILCLALGIMSGQVIAYLGQ